MLKNCIVMTCNLDSGISRIYVVPLSWSGSISGLLQLFDKCTDWDAIASTVGRETYAKTPPASPSILPINFLSSIVLQSPTSLAFSSHGYMNIKREGKCSLSHTQMNLQYYYCWSTRLPYRSIMLQGALYSKFVFKPEHPSHDRLAPCLYPQDVFSPYGKLCSNFFWCRPL